MIDVFKSSSQITVQYLHVFTVQRSKLGCVNVDELSYRPHQIWRQKSSFHPGEVAKLVSSKTNK